MAKKLCEGEFQVTDVQDAVIAWEGQTHDPARQLARWVDSHPVYVLLPVSFRDRVRRIACGMAATHERLRQCLARRKAQVRALEARVADTARVDWLQENYARGIISCGKDRALRWAFMTDKRGEGEWYSTLRAAIDAAGKEAGDGDQN